MSCEPRLAIDPITGCLCLCPCDDDCPDSGNGTYGSPNAFSDLNYNEWYVRSYKTSNPSDAGATMYFLKPESPANVGGGTCSPAYNYRVQEESGSAICVTGSYPDGGCFYRAKLEDAGDCSWDARIFLRRSMEGNIIVDYGYGAGSCGNSTIYTHVLVGPSATDKVTFTNGEDKPSQYIIDSSDGLTDAAKGCCGMGPIWNLGPVTGNAVTPSGGTFSGTDFKAGFGIESAFSSFVQDGLVFNAVTSGPDTADSATLWQTGVKAATFPVPAYITFKVVVAEAGSYKIKVWAGANTNRLGTIDGFRKISMDISVKVGSGAYATMITDFEPQPTYTPTDPSLVPYAGPTGTVGGPDAAGNDVLTGGPWAEESSGTFTAAANDTIEIKLARAAKWSSSSAAVKDAWKELALSAVGLIKQ